MDDEDDRIAEVFRQAQISISAIQGDSDDTPDLFAKVLTLHVGAVLGCTVCPGCAAILAGICNDVLADSCSPWRLVASDDRSSRHLLLRICLEPACPRRPFVNYPARRGTM